MICKLLKKKVLVVLRMTVSERTPPRRTGPIAYYREGPGHEEAGLPVTLSRGSVQYPRGCTELRLSFAGLDSLEPFEFDASHTQAATARETEHDGIRLEKHGSRT